MVSMTAPPHVRRGRFVTPLVLLPGAPLVIVTAYLSLVTAAAWWATWLRPDRRRSSGPARHRFVVLVPAHDEEVVIGAALESLAALDYPNDLYAVHVVADNCTDGTVRVVGAHGVEAHVRDVPDDPGKGPALQWVLRRLQDRDDDFDAVVILDADTTVSPNFLRVMDEVLCSGAEVVQSYYAVRDAGQSSTTAFRSAALAVRHYLRPLGRTRLGGSAGLHGNGMVFRTDVLTRHGWTNHLTEDVELQLDLLLEGTQVAFAPEAVVWAEMPTTLEGSQTQHERWERGRIELTRRYVPRLLRRSIEAKGRDRLACLDAAVDQVLPPLSVTVAATVAWSALVLAVAAAVPERRRVATVAGATLAAQGVYVLSGLRMVHAPAAVYRSLLAAPRLVAWKVRLWFSMLGRRKVSWVRTVRNAEPAAARSTP
jgi:GT2 family glycosyltransferase